MHMCCYLCAGIKADAHTPDMLNVHVLKADSISGMRRATVPIMKVGTPGSMCTKHSASLVGLKASKDGVQNSHKPATN